MVALSPSSAQILASTWPSLQDFPYKPCITYAGSLLAISLSV